MGKIHSANGGYWVGRDPQSQLYQGHGHPCEGLRDKSSSLRSGLGVSALSP